MQILEVKNLALPEVKIIRYKRFLDHRGYFSETFRKSDFENDEKTAFLKGAEFLQTNEAFSRAGVVRGLHFQFNPYMGKLVRTLAGRMIDFALDIRKDSETFGKIIAYDMPYNPKDDYGEWIWLPPGFAHGNAFRRDSRIEYFCTGRYNPEGEVSISPMAKDIDWSLCEPKLKREFDKIAVAARLISDKDKSGLSLRDWRRDTRLEEFTLGKLKSAI